MRVEPFRDAASMVEVCGEWLGRHEAEHNVLLGKRTAGAVAEAFARVVDRGATQVVAGLTPGRALQLSRAESGEAVDRLAEAFVERADEIAMVAGPTDVAARFAEAWERVGGRTMRRAMLQRIYALTRLQGTRSVRGSFRAAAPSEGALLADWAIAFAEDARLPATDLAAMRAATTERIANQTLFVWEDSEPVSMAANVRNTPNGAGVSLVYTPPSLRGRGYASSCAAALSAHLLARGKRFCFLYADQANPTSNGLYTALGYEAVADAAVWVPAA